MALRFVDSFDHYSTSQLVNKYTNVSANVAIQATLPRTGTSHLTMTWGNAYIYNSFDNQQTWIIGFGYYLPDLPSSDHTILKVSDSGSNQCELSITSTGAVKVTRDGTQLSITSAGVITTDVWNYIEFKVYISNSGNYNLKVNSYSVTSGSSVDTQATLNAYANIIYLYSGTVITSYFDDFYVCDGSGTTNNDFLGDCKVDAKFANANGTNQDFTPSTGIDHYAVIDETSPNSDTDYLYSSTVNHKDTNAFSDISITGSLLGLQLSSFMCKDDAGSRTVAPVIRSGGIDYVGTNVSLSNSYTYYSQVYETDPNTSIAWTQSGINNAEYGIKLVA